ncbi:helix-hairpin-helix domain-containing protein [[Acholeplasma] multilocale]|uniref:helix-hairpin-helix domain-containing protein n=1 Tax=[Acholeplasma] multilocale TaxID=264638 RepID=UPI00047CB568|nr:helix-hairpin-helix domain-containing protein [[Acholeplasma] multilocale]
MQNYIIGIVEYFDDEVLYFRNQDQGYKINILTKDQKHYLKNETVKIFIASQTNEFVQTWIGFISRAERDIFLELLNVKTIGLKTASLILNTYDSNQILEIVQNYDLDRLGKIKGLGSVGCKLIIEHLNKVYFENQLSIKKKKVMESLIKLGLILKWFITNLIK